MTNTRNPFRPRPLSFAIASVLTLGAASAETGLDTAGERAKAREPFPLCTPGLEKTAGTGGLALYELGNGEFVADYALGDAAEKCLKGTAAGYTIRLDGQTFNLAGSGGQVVVVRPPVANAPRVVEADSINPALCESYFDGTNGYALELTDANGDLLGGGSLPGILSVGFNPGNGQFTPVVMAAVHAPYIQCYDATTANAPHPPVDDGSGAFFSSGFESYADLRVSFLDVSDQPLADDELLTTIGSNSIYKVRIANVGLGPATDVRIREFLPRAGGFLSPAMSAENCSPDAGSPACTAGANGALSVDIPSLAAGESVTYTLERLVAGSVDLPAASGALTAVAAFVDPDTTRESSLADNARHLRIGLQSNAPPEADPKVVVTPEDTAVAVLLSGEDTDGTVEGYAIASQPLHGGLSGTAPNLTYTPDLDYNGPDSFTYTVIDDRGTASAPATVSITVNPVNDAPRYVTGFIENQGLVFAENGELWIQFNGSFVDPDNGNAPLPASSFALVSDPPLPSGIEYQSGPNQLYDSVVDFDVCNSASCDFDITVTVTNPTTLIQGHHDFTLTITNTNRPPVADTIPPQANFEGDVVTLDLTDYFSDPDGADSLTYAIVQGELPDGLSLNAATGEITGTISEWAANGQAPRVFEIEVSATDNHGLSAPADLNWSVTFVNQPPQVVGTGLDDVFSSVPDPGPHPIEILKDDILAAFEDADGDTLVITAVDGRPWWLSWSQAGSQNITGTPPPGSEGTYEITVTVSDGRVGGDVSDTFSVFVSS